MEDEMIKDSPAESTEKYVRKMNLLTRESYPDMNLDQISELIGLNRETLRVYLARGEISNHTTTYYKNRLKYIKGLTQYDVQYIRCLVASRRQNIDKARWQ